MCTLMCHYLLSFRTNLEPKYILELFLLFKNLFNVLFPFPETKIPFLYHPSVCIPLRYHLFLTTSPSFSVGVFKNPSWLETLFYSCSLFAYLQIIVHIKYVYNLCGSLTRHETFHRSLGHIYRRSYFLYQSFRTITCKETIVEVRLFTGFNRSHQLENKEPSVPSTLQKTETVIHRTRNRLSPFRFSKEHRRRIDKSRVVRQ